MKVLYAGSFNPWHNGHQYVYDSACKYFGKDNVIVGFGVNSDKPINKLDVLKWSLNPLNINNIVTYTELTAEFCNKNNIDLLVRGVRSNDFNSEYNLYHWNKQLGGIESIFIPTPLEYQYLSSSVIRELDKYNKEDEILKYCNPLVYYRWKKDKIPDRIIFYGKSCCGKSYYVKFNYGTNIFNFDASLGKYLKKKYDKDTYNVIVDVFNKLKINFNNGNIEYFKCLIETLNEYIDWDYILKYYEYSKYIDFPELGCYYKYITPKTLSDFYITEITSNQNTRELNCKDKKWDLTKLNMLDNIYIDMPFKDSTISNNRVY